jgi:putative tricarboxylic transport membrane protein
MDRIGAVAMLLFGLFWIWIGTGYTMIGRNGGPGAGVLPTALGVIIVGLALASFFRPEVDRIKLPQLGRILLILGALAGYALLLNPLGYIIATALLMGALLMSFAERKAWWQPVAAIGIAVGTYAVFHSLLQMPLPVDPLELVP